MATGDTPQLTASADALNTAFDFIAQQQTGAQMVASKQGLNDAFDQIAQSQSGQVQSPIQPQLDALNSTPTLNPQENANAAVDALFNSTPTYSNVNDNTISASIINENQTPQNMFTAGSILNPDAGQEGIDIAYNQLQNSINPPIYRVNGYDETGTTNNNPNARLKEQSKDANARKDPKSEINKGGTDNHKITQKEIKDLEVQTNLSLYPYIFGGELARVKHQFSALNINKYYLLLNLLVYGFDNRILQSGVYGQQQYVIDQTFLNDFIKMAKVPQLQSILQKTPAWQKGCFKDLGKFGTTQANATNMNTNPITGPKSEHPGLVSELLERIHPGLVASIDNYCNVVRTKSYLTLPRTSFASIQQLVKAINGIIRAFQQLVYSIYNGIMYYIQQISAIINGLIAKIRQLIMMFLERIIPVDLLCILLAIFGKMINDLPFFQSIANFENMINKFTSQLTQEVNKAFGPILSFANDPLGAVTKGMNPQVKQIIQMAIAVAQDPNAYIAGFMSNFGYGMAVAESQQGIVEQFDALFTPLYSEYSPIGRLLKGVVSGGWQGQGAKKPTDLPPTPPTHGSDKYRKGKQDAYGHPLNANEVGINTVGQGSIDNYGLPGSQIGPIDQPIGNPESLSLNQAIATQFPYNVNPSGNLTINTPTTPQNNFPGASITLGQQVGTVTPPSP